MKGSYCLQKKTKETFAYEWTRYKINLEEEEYHTFFEEIQGSPQELKGKVVLDAGCGMGRYSRIAAKYAKKVVGVDLCEAIKVAERNLKTYNNVFFIQGNLLYPPFRKSSFDFVYSLGVLHHTPNAKETFFKIAKLVKQKGTLVIWVYGKAGSFKSFTTNLYKNDRRLIVDKIGKIPLGIEIYFSLVHLREKVNNLIRLMTTRMPYRMLYKVCYILALLGKIPFLKYLTASVHPFWQVRVQENFDWFSPEYQSHHTKEEVLEWFKEAGFSVISLLRHGLIPKVGVKGVKKY